MSTFYYKTVIWLIIFVTVLMINMTTPTKSNLRVTKQLPHPGEHLVCTQPLGAIYGPQATVFRVFAPTANHVNLRLYLTPSGGQAVVYPMKFNPDGSWEVTVREDCRGRYYTLTAAGDDPGFDPQRELIDPYARAVTAYNGRAIVVQDDTVVAPRPKFPLSEAIIYEMHLRDFTIDPDSGVQQRGKFLGLTEADTHLFGRTDISTGLDHLSELGINTIQLMPLMEFQSNETADEYGWGYDSVHFNTPDGWYATERYDARRVSEMKRMVDSLHRRGIRVILDVVYNHTMEDLFKKRVYSFEGLVPGYYYRRKANGDYWNGSGVGNEFRSESPMGRRFIIDSVKYLVTEYGLDGFRFDLMGLIDLETLKLLTKELHAIDPNIIIYGEPWSAGDTPIKITDKGKQRHLGFAVFNDHFRDALKGSVFHPRERGYIQGGVFIDKVKQGIKGSIDDFTANPVESLNYVECHDNHTFWDRLLISTYDDSNIADTERRAMNKLGAAILFTSQGLPFFQSGQEFLRSKGGNENSYNKPDAVNMLRWQQKALNQDIYQYYRGLIALRNAHPLFRLSEAKQVRQALKFFDTDLGLTVPEKGIAYQLTDVAQVDSWKRALVLFNATDKPQTFTIPAGQWQVYVDDRQASLLPLASATAKIANNTVKVAPRSALVLGE
jgi:pullulanase